MLTNYTTHSLTLVAVQQVAAIRLFLYRMVKRVRRLVTGNSEIARICGGTRPNGAAQAHSRDMTKAFWDEWSTSKKLRLVFTDCGKDPNMDINATKDRICDAKSIGDDRATYVSQQSYSTVMR